MSSLTPKRSAFRFPQKDKSNSMRDDVILELNELKNSIKQVEKQQP